MKKIISSILALVLMLGLMPMSVFADTDETAPATVEETESVCESTEENELPALAEEESLEESAEESLDSEESTERAADTVPAAPVEPEAPIAPVLPNLEGLSDSEANRLIEAYNQDVERYNAEIETYNQALEAYQQTVEAYNADAERYNAEAEQYNADAEAHNQVEYEKLSAYEAQMETYNSRLEVYNKNVATIARIHERNSAKIEGQMEELGGIGRVDKESILSLGTVLEEDYYKNYGRRSVQLGKAGDLVIYWDDLNAIGDGKTILVNEGEASDVSYKVANLHIFQDFESVTEMWDYQEERGWDCMNINLDDENGCMIIPAALINRMVMMEYEIAEVGKNDSVTVTSQTPVFNGTGLTTPRFLEGFTDGPYWANDVVFTTNAMEYDCDFTGTQHTFSFENGTCDYSDIKNTLNVNRYFFTRYSNPAPVEPEKFTADLIASRDLLSPLSVTLAKLEDLSFLALRKITVPSAPVTPVVPTVVTPTKPVVDPVEEEVIQDEELPPVVPAVEDVIEDEQMPLAAPVVEDVIEDEEMPLAAPIAEEAIAEPAPLPAADEWEELPSVEVPLASFASWALLNLIACILSVLFAIAALIRRREEGSEESALSGDKLFTVVAAALSVVLFVLTENMHLAMRLVDRWTLPMLLILAASAVVFFVKRPAPEKAAA